MQGNRFEGRQSPLRGHLVGSAPLSRSNVARVVPLFPSIACGGPRDGGGIRGGFVIHLFLYGSQEQRPWGGGRHGVASVFRRVFHLIVLGGAHRRAGDGLRPGGRGGLSEIPRLRA